jgi:hypothetical protein
MERLFSKGASPDCHAFFPDHGADVNARDLDGQTPLKMAPSKPRRPENAAQKKERQTVVELLKSRGAKK